jgi:cobalt-zinc-cadmium efflux system membrane fusion protein
MAGAGLLTLLAVSFTACDRSTNDAAAAPEHAGAPGPLNYPRGPHGARLLSDAGLRLEITIYETGVRPQFRVYAYDDANKPIAPRDVRLTIELHRLGGRLDRIDFQPEADYLRGHAVVEEPHSFDVKVAADHAGRSHTWEYSQIEGKVRLAPESVKSAEITIARAEPRRMVTTLDVPGEIEPDATRVARVVSRLSGVVLEARKQAGDRVRRGDVLAVISSRELADAKSAYMEAAHRVEFSHRTFEREEGLWKKKISPEQDYLNARQSYEEAQLQQEVAGQKLVALGLPSSVLKTLSDAPVDSLPHYQITAPLDGTVIERDVTIGESVNETRAIFVIADLSSVWANATIAAKDLAAVRIGQEATIRSRDLGRDTRGRIAYISSLVGEGTRSAVARVVIPNRDGLWRPGLFVTIGLEEEIVTVPIAVRTEAIQTFRDWQVVFVRYGDWFEGRPLELGRSDGEFTEVLSGLKPGEEYAATNSFAVKAEIGKLGATHDH